MRNPFVKADEIAKRLFQIAPFINIMAPAMVIGCGVVMVFAVMQVQKALAAGGQQVAVMVQKTIQPKLNTVPLDRGGYNDAVAVLSRLNPNVLIEYKTEKDILRVTIADPARLPEWLYLLSTVQAYRKGLIWNATEICLKKCEGGHAAVADIRAATQNIAIQ